MQMIRRCVMVVVVIIASVVSPQYAACQSHSHGDRQKFVPSDTVAINLDDVYAAADTTVITLPDFEQTTQEKPEDDYWLPRQREFNPDPTRAVWLAALFPGAGQIYNRRYWKLPIIVGGFLGLGYATGWNNTMLSDYAKAYSDIMDNDPTTNSYMDFFPSNVTESSLDKTWLTNLLQTRKNFFRRNRDICIIGMVAVYLLSIIDSYVDASLAHFDISPDLSMDVVPSLMQDGRNTLPSVGLLWAFNF